MAVNSMRTGFLAAAGLVVFLTASPANAQEKFKVIASFSILGDLVANIGGDRVTVDTLVGRNDNAHTYNPSPADAKKIADARIVFVNGLGFEGWLDRLIKASGTKAPIVVATTGVKTIERGVESGHGHDHGKVDPHAWQSVTNAKIYATNIRDGLIAIDPDGKATYGSNAAAYVAKLDALEQEVRIGIARIPPDRRRIITSHTAFGYFEDSYGISFSAPQGMSTDAEASAKDVASIIAQVKQQKVAGVFLENVTDPRLIRQIARESGAKVGGVLYSDALTDKKGEAPTYIDLIRHNLKQLVGSLTN
jgi:zinc/manganese transport system substrate-binding protein